MGDRDDADVVFTEPAGTPIARGGAVSLAFGVVIGVAAGLIGVGGEFHIPVLLHALRLPIKVASGVNRSSGCSP